MVTDGEREINQTSARRRPAVKPQVLKGFRDYLPRQMILRQRIIALFRGVFERHGYEPLDTPVLEHLEVLTGKAGENERLMYHFEDQGGRAVGLRYDLTVPLSRVVAMHQNDLVLPFKRYQIAPVWRAEKPQRGRFREFWQCDADIVGSPSMLADAEAITVMAEALAAVGLPQATIRINHRKLLTALALLSGVDAARAGGVYRAIDRLDKVGPDGVDRELIGLGVPAGAAKRILDLVTRTGAADTLLSGLREQLAGVPGAAEAIGELEQLFAYLPQFGIPASAYVLDLALARGLDYYTGPVFEASVEQPKIGSVGGAGRYDDLIGTFLGRGVPATGMSLGIERIIEVVEEFGLLPVQSTVTEVFVVAFPETMAAAAGIARDLRAAGRRVDLSLLPSRGVGDQLKYAGRKGIPLAVIAGATELDAGTVALKDLRSNEQRTLALIELPGAVERLLHLEQ
ncbi:MAG: Histidyl-tRNA synthetase [uncultured Thermomicrobiales bacterium]|uniref:Histidine--tRNA ligase n=1 Tax=uncultured Thermomicrobiales bacterium TaxID=1645740 RepID=A0A6J4TV52_9BACT|nr:MAG: Histidyl-tRNA synthetase [uncultured Thermomicrobiales bacterium]